jgi:hypothetical protein
VSHEEGGQVPKLTPRILDSPFDVGCLVFPARFPVRTILAPLLVKRGLPESTLVKAEHGYPAIPESAVDVLVTSNVLAKPVDEDEDGFWVVGFVCAGVDLAVLGPREPAFRVRSRRRHRVERERDSPSRGSGAVVPRR